MLASRGLSALRAVRLLSNVQKLNTPHGQQAIRQMSGHAWVYRSGIQPSKNIILASEVIGGGFWFWVLWHLFTEPEHISGEFEYPDPRKWTDKELGISN